MTKTKYNNLVSIYLKSGAIIEMKFIDFKCTKLSGSLGNRSFSWEDQEHSITIDTDEVSAVIIKSI